MNLKLSHLPVLLIGAVSGSALGYLVCHILQGTFLRAEDLPTLGLAFGGLAGAGIGVLASAIAASRDREAEAPAQFTCINGIGSMLYGKSDDAADGSYVATEWFTIFFIPVIPICSYRVIKTRGTLVARQYQILEKFPPRRRHVVLGYLVSVSIASIVIVFALLIGDSR